MAQLRPVDGTDYYLWKFLPSVLAAVIFIILFTIVTGILCWRTVKTRSWFCIPFALGGLFQIIGYGVRVFAHYRTDLIAPYTVQSCFILLAPVLYTASVYMVLGRLIRSVHGERFSIVRPAKMTKLFVLADFLSLNVQGNGAGLTVKKKTETVGKYIVVVGLFIQLIAFGWFVVVALVFHVRMQKNVDKECRLRPTVPWRQGLRMIYICSALIMLRSIFRVVEYVMGVDSYLLTNEWPMYVFDAAPMWIVQAAFLVWFPDRFKPGQYDNIEDGHVLAGNESAMQ
ncbi:uncharacterized protein Z519_01197 [Cladophialophora bantiana CBS 173.52]|uniref:RTA1 domain protein n=1 Tax=Cladophialophora bantiana (strain ATCC 10958 / CBS 173.52 / CDC B-1940 / NIH 8579) TaxID=1442370 RepID=A0A0D2HW88_CLAB1|nr:uncharacterized protein Z519_01197 [Cladophialophora bantiana CBS 173.52]KIW97613.1 hypothetical protein Z519_01197 [Cladophialophora bantiana CBS 173.52]